MCDHLQNERSNTGTSKEVPVLFYLELFPPLAGHCPWQAYRFSARMAKKYQEHETCGRLQGVFMI
jgi:hypothetical protein